MKPITVNKIKKGDVVKATHRKNVPNFEGWESCYFVVGKIKKIVSKERQKNYGKKVLTVKNGYFINQLGESLIVKKPEGDMKGDFCLTKINSFKFHKLTNEEWDSIKARIVIETLRGEE